MKKGLTELVFIVDRSGSMGGMENDTIGGFNATLDAHREADGQALVNTVLFDNEVEVLHDRIPIEQVKPLTSKDYWVRGCTALLDAVGQTITHIDKIHGYLPEESRPEHTIVVITTDGYENASRKYSQHQVKRLIEQKKEAGWDFLYLGADIDAVGEAAKIGIDANYAATYVHDAPGNAVMQQAMCAETVNMRYGAPSGTGSWKASIERDYAKRGGGKAHGGAAHGGNAAHGGGKAHGGTTRVGCKVYDSDQSNDAHKSATRKKFRLFGGR